MAKKKTVVHDSNESGRGLSAPTPSLTWTMILARSSLLSEIQQAARAVAPVGRHGKTFLTPPPKSRTLANVNNRTDIKVLGGMQKNTLFGRETEK